MIHEASEGSLEDFDFEELEKRWLSLMHTYAGLRTFNQAHKMSDSEIERLRHELERMKHEDRRLIYLTIAISIVALIVSIVF